MLLYFYIAFLYPLEIIDSNNDLYLAERDLITSIIILINII